MDEQLRSILIGTIGLDLAAGVALWLTLVRGNGLTASTPVGEALLALGVGVLLQAAHFGEELATGFHVRFPELLGLSPWPVPFFVAFNTLWLAVWILSLLGLSARHRAALFPLWFLGLACVANGGVHPVLSFVAGGYFPGLLTSPFVGVAGIVILQRLARITREPARDGAC